MLSNCNHNTSFDILKLIFSIFVVIIHSMGRYAGYPFIRTAVPMFFFISGYLYFRKQHKNENVNNRLHNYWHYIKRILILYLAWFIVLLPYLIYTRQWFSNGILNGLGILIIRFVFNSTFTGSWYLMAVVIGIGLLHIMSQKFSDEVILLFSIIIYFLCCAASNYRGLFNKNNIIFFLIYNYPGTFYTSFPAGLVWLQIGKMFVNPKCGKKISIHKLLVFFVMSLILLFGEYLLINKLECCVDNDCYLMLLPLVCCVGAFAVWYDLPGSYLWLTKEKSYELRNVSTIIFCSHGACITLMTKILKAFPLMENIFFVAILKCIGTLVLCIIASYIILKFSKKAYGKWLNYFM